MMADLRTPTDEDELLDKIIAEIELLEQQPEQISDIVGLASLIVHHNRCSNAYLDEMVATLTSVCVASQSQMKQQHEMILQFQKQLETITNIHQIDSQTNVGQQLHQTGVEQKPTAEMTNEIDTGNQSQTGTDVVMTNKQPEQFNVNHDNLNKMAAIELRQQLKAVTSIYPVKFPGEVQNLHQVQGQEQTVGASSPLEVEICDAVLNVLLPLNVSNHVEQHQEIASVCDMPSTVEINGRRDIIIRSGEQSSISESRRAEPLRGIGSMEQQRQSIPVHSGHNNADLDEMVARLANDSATLKIQVKEQREMILKLQEQLQTVADIQQMYPQVDEEATNKRPVLDDSTQMEQVYESDNVQLSTEECSERDGVIALSNVSIDAQQHCEQEGTMLSPQMKVCFVQLRKINAKQVASNSEKSKNPQNTRRSKKPFVCTDCGAAFNHTDHLKRHQRIHSGEKPYMCAYCDVTFSRADTLKKHQRIHSGEKPYMCADCGAAFSRADRLKGHQRVHSGKKRFSCADCGAAFNRADHLERHQIVHSGEKPFVCTDCSAAFAYASSLKRHQKIHSDEKPFVCHICKKSFQLKRDLSLHVGIHSGKRWHKCNVCNKEFRRRRNLNEHLQLHYN